jgi:hypothetical protein
MKAGPLRELVDAVAGVAGDTFRERVRLFRIAALELTDAKQVNAARATIGVLRVRLQDALDVVTSANNDIANHYAKCLDREAGAGRNDQS